MNSWIQLPDDLTLVYPWLLVLIPVIGWFCLRKENKPSLTIAATELWSDLDQGRAKYLPWLTAFKALGLIALITAIARPQAIVDQSYQSNEGIAIQMLVDISSSMEAEVTLVDGPAQTRMEASKEIVERFIAGDGNELNGRPNDLIGLITFARYADTRSPLTFGHSALVEIVRSIESQNRPNEDGTAYGDALALAAARLHQLDQPLADGSANQYAHITSRIVVLLTDGENNSGSHEPLAAASLAKEWGCKVYIISLGDEPYYGKNRPVDKEDVLTPAEQVLERISKETGGIYRKATDYESLLSVYEEIDQLEKSKIATKSYKITEEIFWLPLAFAFLFLLLVLALKSTVLRIAP